MKVELNGNELNSVIGGTIVFNEDMTSCGHNISNEYNVVNLNEVLKYIDANRGKMYETQILANLASMGYLTKR